MANDALSVGVIILFTLLSLYMIVGAIIEHRKPILGHETGFIILISMLVGGIASLIVYEDFKKLFTFN